MPRINNEAELINRAKAADPQALTVIYERYASAIYLYIYYRVGDAELAEDLRAEVFLRMIEGIEKYEDRGWPISAWLYRIARDRTIDALRRRYRRPQVPLETWTDTCEGPEVPIEVKLDHEELRKSIEHLTEGQRQVILLRFMGDLSVQEVAKKLGRTEGAVKALQHRGLQTLARILEADQTDDTEAHEQKVSPARKSGEKNTDCSAVRAC